VLIDQRAAFSREKQNIAKLITKLPKFHNHDSEICPGIIELQAKNWSLLVLFNFWLLLLPQPV